ncbi:methyltransferase domain-containing protein [Candidatus Woesearchaeota archaeon]|nr:methyltransferase domain-containing protein [Candidatus Woesearchaeota archaeon]
MKYIFVLLKNDLALAKEEVLSLINSKSCELIENVLVLCTSKKNERISINEAAKRLAYTNSISLLLFESDYKNFLKCMENFNWNSVYKGSFCVRIKKLFPEFSDFNNKKSNGKNAFKEIFSESNIASYIWKNVKKPKVNPRLARAMVNLTKAGKNELILDPFCGSGGILIEAGLISLKAIGFDINKKMIWKSMVNLRHYKIKNYELEVKDFFSIDRKYKFIVSDLPYGLNAAIMGKVRITKSNKKLLKKYIEKFYFDVIKKLELILIKRAVIIFPSYVNYKKLLKKSKLKLKSEFESYVHGNLTRKILVLEK